MSFGDTATAATTVRDYPPGVLTLSGLSSHIHPLVKMPSFCACSAGYDGLHITEIDGRSTLTDIWAAWQPNHRRQWGLHNAEVRMGSDWWSNYIASSLLLLEDYLSPGDHPTFSDIQQNLTGYYRLRTLNRDQPSMQTPNQIASQIILINGGIPEDNSVRGSEFRDISAAPFSKALTLEQIGHAIDQQMPQFRAGIDQLGRNSETPVKLLIEEVQASQTPGSPDVIATPLWFQEVWLLSPATNSEQFLEVAQRIINDIDLD